MKRYHLKQDVFFKAVGPVDLFVLDLDSEKTFRFTGEVCHLLTRLKNVSPDSSLSFDELQAYLESVSEGFKSNAQRTEALEAGLRYLAEQGIVREVSA